MVKVRMAKSVINHSSKSSTFLSLGANRINLRLEDYRLRSLDLLVPWSKPDEDAVLVALRSVLLRFVPLEEHLKLFFRFPHSDANDGPMIQRSHSGPNNVP